MHGLLLVTFSLDPEIDRVAAAIKRFVVRGISCSSLGWPAGWPCLYFGWRGTLDDINAWLSGRCNFTPTMRCHAVIVKIGLYSSCNLATLQPILWREAHEGLWCPWPVVKLLKSRCWNAILDFFPSLSFPPLSSILSPPFPFLSPIPP